ncbi:hypothetical protein NCGM1179_2854 [Pseudomonas aeruginosa NCMG1179]|nr:hypothetical protein CSC44_5999 [Pseudomonas aeruginosa]GAA18023.1 hypothetical protein NCGM1179_2854 [Pseudomonas aeruginosa NCMG1179]
MRLLDWKRTRRMNPERETSMSSRFIAAWSAANRCLEVRGRAWKG